jgi:hypothetical protein
MRWTKPRASYSVSMKPQTKKEKSRKAKKEQKKKKKLFFLAS